MSDSNVDIAPSGDGIGDGEKYTYSSELNDHEYRMLIQACTHKRTDMSKFFITFDTQALVKMPRIACKPFPRSKPVELGRLSRLPDEILLRVLDHISMKDFLHFRRVNTRTRLLAFSYPPWDIVASKAPEVLYAFFETRLASYFPIRQIFEELRSQTCRICGQIGSFMHLPLAIRCCFHCLHYSEHCQVTYLHKLALMTLTGPSHLRELLTVMRSPPGRYGFAQEATEKESEIVPLKAGRDVASHLIAQFPEPAATQRYEALEICRRFLTDWPIEMEWQTDLKVRYNASMAMPCFRGPQWTNLDYLSCTGCEVVAEEQNTSRVMRPSDPSGSRLYTYDSYIDHWHKCSKAQELWADTVCDRAVSVPHHVRIGGRYQELVLQSGLRSQPDLRFKVYVEKTGGSFTSVKFGWPRGKFITGTETLASKPY